MDERLYYHRLCLGIVDVIQVSKYYYSGKEEAWVYGAYISFVHDIRRVLVSNFTELYYLSDYK